MVIVQFRGRLVRQYRACVVDSLGLGITCVLYNKALISKRKLTGSYPWCKRGVVTQYKRKFAVDMACLLLHCTCICLWFIAAQLPAQGCFCLLHY